MSVEADILAAIKNAGPAGATCSEIEALLSTPRRTVAPRINELASRGVIRDSGRKRDSLSPGSTRQSVVWVACEDKSESTPAVEKKIPRRISMVRSRARRSRKFWDDLSDRVVQYALKSTDGVEEIVIEQLCRELRSEIHAAVQRFQTNTSRAQKKGKERAEVSEAVARTKMVDACRVLNVDPPRVGKPVDLKRAKKAKRALVRAYHPDAGSGNSEAYQSVIEAYDALESYNLGLGQKSGTNGVPTSETPETSMGGEA